MILYNNKYRGQFEHEKFVLNILSFHNIIKDLETIEVQGTADEFETLLSIHEDVNNFINDLTGNDSISDRFYLLAIKEREGIKL